MTKSGAVLIQLLIHIATASLMGIVPLSCASQKQQELKNAEAALVEGAKQHAISSAAACRIALERYQYALQQFTDLNDLQGQARAHRRLGDVYFTIADKDTALKHFNKAIDFDRSSNKKAETPWAFNGLASVYISQIAKEKAIGYCAKALKACQTIDDSDCIAHALNNYGDYYAIVMGDKAESNKYYFNAIERWESISSDSGQALAWLNLGYNYSDLNSIPEALQAHNRALTLWRKAGNDRGQAKTLAALMQLYDKLSNYDEIMKIYFDARDKLQKIEDKRTEASVLNTLGSVNYRLGRMQTALPYHQKALTTYREISEKRMEGVTLLPIGKCHYELQQYDQALEYYNKALTIFRGLPDRRIESYILRYIAVVYSALNKDKEALELLNEALSINRELKDTRMEAHTLNNIGMIHLDSGEAGKAAKVFEAGISLNRQVLNRYGEFISLSNLARALEAQNRLEEAIEPVQAAIDICEKIRLKIPSYDLRSSYFAAAHHNYALYVDLLMRLGSFKEEPSYHQKAFEVSENGRARALIEILMEEPDKIRKDIDVSLLEKERILNAEISNVADKQARILSKEHSEEEAKQLERQLAKLENDLDQLHAEIKIKSPHYAALTMPKTITVDRIQKELLDEDTVLLEYALCEERSYVWLIEQKEIHSYELPPRRELEAIAQRVYDLLIERQRKVVPETAKLRFKRYQDADQGYWRESKKLSSILLGSVADRIKGKRLLIVSDGFLQYIPFRALPLPYSDDAQGDRQGPAPLITQHEVVNLASALSLAVLRETVGIERPTARNVAIFADAVYEADDPRIRDKIKRSNYAAKKQGTLRSAESAFGLRDAGKDEYRLARLPHTSDEAKAILSVIPESRAMVAMGLDATRTRAMSPELKQFHILHFATHGLLNEEHPILSGLVLSTRNGQGEEQNGFLRLHDIYNLEIPAELVVLSACNTALGKNVRGEGLIGLVRGFMYAGAARVMASLWKVEDKSTSELMAHFYKHLLQDQMTAAAALKAAQVEMWNSRNWSAPYYWAGFTLQGEYK